MLRSQSLEQEARSFTPFEVTLPLFAAAQIEPQMPMLMPEQLTQRVVHRACSSRLSLVSPVVSRRRSSVASGSQWKQRIVNDLDGAFGMETYVDLATDERHTDEKMQEMVDAEGSRLGSLREGRKDGMKFEWLRPDRTDRSGALSVFRPNEVKALYFCQRGRS